MATSTASTSTAPYPTSITTTSGGGGGVPPTQLPVDPHTLTRYLRSRQLAALRGLYEYKTLAVAQQIEQHAASLRGRHGRARRRRGSSPLEERDLDAEDDEDDLEVRKRLRYDPAADSEYGATGPARATATGGIAAGDESAPASGASTPLLPGTRSSSQRVAVPPAAAATSTRVSAEAVEGAVDPVHVYDYVFDLAPDSSSDAYYHGAHPAPPARVVRTVLRATQRKPFVDPAGLSTAQLEALTAKLWDEEGKGLSIFFGESSSSSSAAAAGQKRRGGGQPLSRDQERYQREVNAEAQDEWEMAVIAGFSARCDQQIEQNLRRKPITAREMQAQAQAQQQQQQQVPPSAGSMPAQPIPMEQQLLQQPAPPVSSSSPSTSGAPVSASAGPTASAPVSAPAPAPASVPPPPPSSYAALPSSVGYGMTAAVDYATQHQRATEARYGTQGAPGGSAGVGGAGGAAGWRW